MQRVEAASSEQSSRDRTAPRRVEPEDWRRFERSMAEIFTAFYSGDEFEIAMTTDRWTGVYAPVYWAMMACNVLAPQLLWWRACRRSVWLLFALSLPMQYAAGTSLVVITIASAAALVARSGAGGSPDWGVVLALTAGSAQVASHVPSPAIRRG